jgi:hypothetical protein
MSDNKTPLDKSKVRAGDTVTIVVADEKHPPIHVTGEVYEGFSGHLAVGPHLLSRISIVLTDHQPSPKPEWKPGTKGEATINGRKVGGFISKAENQIGFYYWNGFTGRTSYTAVVPDDFVPDETRPLPSWEQVRTAVWRAADDSTRVSTIDEIADATLALLRGESR